MLPEAVAALANMVEAALGAGAVGGERGREDHGLASGAGGGRVFAAVLAEAGAENFRSTERQYALAEEAARLGWEAERIAVVDGDLGISGRFSDTQARKGYTAGAAGLEGVPGRGRGDLRVGGLEAGAVERRDAAAA